MKLIDANRAGKGYEKRLKPFQVTTFSVQNIIKNG